MPDIDLTDPIFSDEEKAREHLAAQRWPGGVACPICGGLDAVSPFKGASMGPGWYHCNDCRDKFTVRVGSVMERSHIPLTKWALAFHLMCSSKKGISAKQMQRQLGFKSYKTAWFVCHRIREAVKPDSKAGPLGCPGKVLESDETFVGGRAKNAKRGKPEPKKRAVHALVEPGGRLHATHVPNVTARTLRAVLKKHADNRSACTPTTRWRTYRSARTSPTTRPSCTARASTTRTALACSRLSRSSRSSSAVSWAASTQSASSIWPDTSPSFSSVGMRDPHWASRIPSAPRWRSRGHIWQAPDLSTP
jgi:transposase-like protein